MIGYGTSPVYITYTIYIRNQLALGREQSLAVHTLVFDTMHSNVAHVEPDRHKQARAFGVCRCQVAFVHTKSHPKSKF